MILDTVKKGLEEIVGQPAAEEEPAAAEATQPAEGEEGTEEKKEEEVAAPRKPVELTDYRSKGFHLDVEVPVDKLIEAVQFLDAQKFSLEAITGVDWLADGQMEVVYDFNHHHDLCRVALRTRVARDNPEVPTISHIFGGANWHERETHDFFGIVFAGHPDLTPLLLPEDADFHPLLKDFKP